MVLELREGRERDRDLRHGIRAQREGLLRMLDEMRRDGRPGAAPSAYSPYDRPITSSITSSVPAPIRFRRMSRQARSIPYSFM